MNRALSLVDFMMFRSKSSDIINTNDASYIIFQVEYQELLNRNLKTDVFKSSEFINRVRDLGWDDYSYRNTGKHIELKFTITSTNDSRAGNA